MTSTTRIFLLCSLCLFKGGLGNTTGSLNYKHGSRPCLNGYRYVRLFGISLETCVFECDVRAGCQAVNYWRHQQKCVLLKTVTETPFSVELQVACIFVRKTDITPSSIPVLSKFILCLTSSVLLNGVKREILITKDGQNGVYLRLMVVGFSAGRNTFHRYCLLPLTLNTFHRYCLLPLTLKECPYRLSFNNGDTLGNRRYIGSKTTVACDDRYYVDPSNQTSVCQSNGFWSAQDLCKLVDCGEPPTQASATVSVGDTTEGAVRRYTCIAGHYALVGSSLTTTCQDTGQWTELMFECRLLDCGEPPTQANAIVSVGDTTEGAVRRYTCIAGHYALVGSSLTTTCLDTGQWTEIMFECRLLDCGEPPTQANAIVSVGDTVEGAVRSYTCIAGHYALAGSSLTTTCQDTGQWTDILFQCGLKTCENGWYRIDDSCYYIERPTSTMDAVGAVSYCHDRQSYLVQLETQQENDDVIAWARSTVSNNPLLFWIGLSDDNLDGTWIWMETGQICTSFAWLPNEPSGKGETHVVIWSSGWVDVDPDYSKNGPFPVCEKSLDAQYL